MCMFPDEFLVCVAACRGAEKHHGHCGVQAEWGHDHVPRVTVGDDIVDPLGKSVEATLKSVRRALEF